MKLGIPQALRTNPHLDQWLILVLLKIIFLDLVVFFFNDQRFFVLVTVILNSIS